MRLAPWVRWALGLLAGLAWAGTSTAQSGPLPFLFRSFTQSNHWDKLCSAALVPLDQVPPAFRGKIHRVLERPILYTQGPAESFTCDPAMYTWLLDHPDRTMVAWRRLGAKCLEIADRGNGWFGWSDGKGNDV